MTIPTTTESSPTIQDAQEPSFDITAAAIPSFGALQQARAQVFSTRKSKDAFAREVGDFESLEALLFVVVLV